MNYGRYQIISEVGRGSMGVVYQARDPNIDRLIAVKVLRQDRMENESVAKRFLKEAKVIGRLSHPNIVAIYDVGEEQGNIYIAMEFLEGVSLSDIIKEKRSDIKEAVSLCIQIAETLEYAHHKGVIHRDIKPSNIIVQEDGQTKITDFGIAHIEDTTATLQTQAGEIMGTPAYMSPEQVLGQPVDGRADIFSLGIILYELCTGTRPFGGEGKNLATVFNEIIQISPREPAIASELVPGELSNIIMKALQKEPDKRFQTGKELAEALRHCFEKKEKPAVEPAKLPERKGIPKYVIPLVATMTSAIIAGGIFYTSQQKETPPAKQPIKTESVQPVPIPLPPAPTPSPEPVRTDIKTVDKELPKKVTSPLPPAPIPARQIEKKLPVPSPVESKQPEIKKKTEPMPSAPAPQPVATKSMPKFAFLKVRSEPKGADVYIDGSLKGTTPMTLKLGLGEYQVRLSSPGYRDSESKIKLEKMKEYPVTEKLKPK